MKAPVGHAGDIGAHAAMTVAKHKAIDHLVAGEALSGAPQQPYFMKIPCFEPRESRMSRTLISPTLDGEAPLLRPFHFATLASPSLDTCQMTK